MNQRWINLLNFFVLFHNLVLDISFYIFLTFNYLIINAFVVVKFWDDVERGIIHHQIGKLYTTKCCLEVLKGQMTNKYA